ncbi:sugar ABC transporter permease [Microbacterium aquimaris]|uniref:carbohydrate ABC transporter permease n=1 Tax=Microbacterium aquimaris TaxID=459816 RepID=UPI002AD5A2C8|nr:sugar ABC transporter permease [Microbacterium aquimaris]MDZ8275270.1 sugar ABC transporter permease [Microbacterium aquimaris]
MRLKALVPWGFLAPAVIVFTALGIWPIVRTVVLSLTNTVGTRGDGAFIGLENYVRLAGDRYFLEAFQHTVIWIVFNLTVPVALALFLALMLNRAVQSKVLKTMFFIPLALSAPAIATIWTFIYQQDTGLIDVVLNAVGLGQLQQQWLGPDWVLLSLMIAGAWRETAFFMVIFLAGLTSVPEELVEAARIDGANRRQVFRHVTIPALRPATMIVMSSAFIGALLTTDLVLAMTKGGPFGQSDVLGYRMYVVSFFNGEFGYGAAIGVVIAVIAAAFVIPYLLRMNRMQEEEN